MDPIDITLDGSQPGDAQLTPSGDTEGVNDSSLTLEELNTMLGKQYPDKATALKGLKDTYSFVGKKAESVKDEVITEATKHTSELAKELHEIKRELWYQKNPQYEPVKNLIEKFPGEPKDIVNLPEFKEVFEKVKGYEETSKLKTVMESSPRLGQVRDSLTRAAEAAQAGNTQQAEYEAVRAVIGTYSK